MAIKLTKSYFSGLGKLFSRDTGGGSDVMRKIAQDLARMRVDQFADMTDSSTGTAVYPPVAPAMFGASLAAFTETGTASAQDAATDTAIGKIKNDHSVLAAYMNTINATLGLPLIVDNSGGTVATAGTIPALDLSVSGVSSSCLNVVTARVTFAQLQANASRLIGYANRILVALGAPKITDSTGGIFDGQPIGAITATGASVDGSALSTVTAAHITTELLAHAATIATIAASLALESGVQLADMTGTPGGTGSLTAVLVQTHPLTAAGAASTSASNANVVTEMGHIEENLSELTYTVNLLLERNGLSPLLTDSTSQSPNGALQAVAQTVSGVDGTQTSPYLGPAYSSFTSNAVIVDNAISSLTAKVNTLCGVYGLLTLTDSAAGIVSTTIANLPATTLQTGGEVATVLATEVNTWLVAVSSNITSLMNKLNLMTTTTNTGANLTTEIPLQVVAWDA